MCVSSGALELSVIGDSRDSRDTKDSRAKDGERESKDEAAKPADARMLCPALIEGCLAC